MAAGILITGNELLEGFVRDANTLIISQFLLSRRREPPRMSIMVPDRMEEIHRGLGILMDGDFEVIIVTGGMGPTEDDITVRAVAEFLGKRLERVEDFPTDLEKYRWRIEGFSMLPNPVGRAPAMWGHHMDRLIVLLPGVPQEVRGFLLGTRLGRVILDHLPLSDTFYMLIKTGGLSEREVRDILSRYYDRIGTPDYMATPSGVILKLRGRERDVKQRAEVVEKILGSYIWGYNDETLEEKVALLLKKRGLTVSTAESCTSGKIPDLLTSVSGSSAYFRGGIVAYSTDVKIHILGVPGDVVERYTVYSHQVAAHMAASIRRIMGSHIGISTTGMAENPDGEPFAFVGIAADEVRTYYREFAGERNLVRLSIAYYALFRLYQLLTGRG